MKSPRAIAAAIGLCLSILLGASVLRAMAAGCRHSPITMATKISK